MINYINVITNIIAGISVLLVSSPTLGELLATMAPIYPKKDTALVKQIGIPFKPVSFPTSGGLTLRGWFFPGKKQDGPTIVYAPATGQDQRSGISLVRPLHRAGFNVLLFSYRGHGLSEGNRFGFTYGAQESKDIDAAVAFLGERMGVGKIGVIGHSAGAAAGIISAARNPKIACLVAAAPFPSVEEIWNNNRPAFFPKALFELTFRFAEFRKRFSRNDVRPQDVIANISPRPILLIHGKMDRRIRQRQAINLYQVAREPKSLWLVEGANHGQIHMPFLAREVEEIISFFKQAFQGMSSLKSGIYSKELSVSINPFLV